VRTTVPCGPALSRARILGAAAVAASALSVGVGVAQASARHGGPASGPRAFTHQIHWSVSSPARGVQLLNGTFSDPAVHPSWTVTIQAPAHSPFDGSLEVAEAGSSAWAQQTEAALTADGFTPTARTIHWPHYADDPRGVLGVRVRVGEFATNAAATAQAATLTADGFHPLVEWEGFDPQQPPDAELLHAAVVDPHAFAGRVEAIHGTAVASRATAAAQAQQVGALAAVNGGFFTIDAPLAAVAGVPTGLGVYDGKLESLANSGRADLVLDGRAPARIENLTSSAELRAGDATERILGINRLPGSNEDCGVPGFAPTDEPRQGTICTGSNDLVLFTPEFGAPLPTGTATQALLDRSGRVVAIGTAGGSLPTGDSALQALGTDATWLAAHLQVGQRVVVDEQLRRLGGGPFTLTPQTSIVSAAPVLLRNGRIDIDASREGVFDPRDLNNYSFRADRHGRTFAGVDRRGRLILVTADGIPGVSEGLTLTEEALLMRSLGAVDAMNLDGGGSTSFVVDGQTVNDPSDATGARPVGDSVVIVP
jgi:Phosphodiester glycosidase